MKITTKKEQESLFDSAVVLATTEFVLKTKYASCTKEQMRDALEKLQEKVRFDFERYKFDEDISDERNLIYFQRNFSLIGEAHATLWLGLDKFEK